MTVWTCRHHFDFHQVQVQRRQVKQVVLPAAMVITVMYSTLMI